MLGTRRGSQLGFSASTFRFARMLATSYAVVISRGSDFTLVRSARSTAHCFAWASADEAGLESVRAPDRALTRTWGDP